MNLVSLTDRHICITGAASGIGKAVARLVVALGARVTLIDTDAKGLAELTSELGSGSAVGCPGSVAEPRTALMAAETGSARFGHIDGLVNNAGILRKAMITQLTDEQWSDVIDVHLNGSYYFLRELGSRMVTAAESGRHSEQAIVNISSDAGRVGTVGQVNYSVAKAGLLGMTMSAAKEWGRFGIRVNTVCFGLIETPMTDPRRRTDVAERYLPITPLGRWGQPDEAAKPVAFLLSDAASFITGQHLSVNGGSFMSA